MTDTFLSKLDLERALMDPSAVFSEPDDVLIHPALTHRNKVDILCHWAYDAAQLSVAEEEGMGGGESSRIGQVLTALHRLSNWRDVEHPAPTKQGGGCIE